MAGVSRSSRARSADRLSSSRFIRVASGHSIAKASSIGTRECLRAWIRAMRMARTIAQRRPQSSNPAKMPNNKGFGEKSFAYKWIFRLDCADRPGSNCAPVSRNEGNRSMAHDAPQATGHGKLVIRNIGLLLSGALEKPILDADTIVAENGKITAIGRAKDVDTERATTIA